MATIVTRASKGSPLTNTEVDANFTNLNTDKAELSGATFTGEIVANAGIALGDNDKATFGASDDLQIYHDGSNSYIDESATGSLLIRGSNLQLRSYGTNEYFFTGVENGASTIYYDGLSKLATTATGIDVTGKVTANDLTLGDASPTLNFNDSDIANLNHYITSASNANLYYAADSAAVATGKHVFTTQNVERFEISATGIDVTGTATMDGLTVDGVVSVDGNIGIDTNHVFGQGLGYGGNTTSAGAGTLTLYNAQTGAAVIDGFGPSYLADSGVVLKQSGVKGFHLKNNNDIEFYEDTGTTPKLFWDASAESLGIGTSAPTSALHVINSTNSGESIATLEAASTKNGYVYINADDDRRKSLVFQSGGVDKFSMGAGDSNELSQNSFFIGSGKTGGSGADLVIDSLGKVGIGTSTPSALLDVNIDGNTGRFSRSGTQYIEVSASSGGQSILSTSGTNKALNIGTTDSNQFRLQTNGSSALTIDASQNVGIGTSSPDQELHVSASATPVIRIESRNQGLGVNESLGSLEFEKLDASGGGAGVASSINCFTTDLGGAIALGFHTGSSAGNNVERMRIDSVGNASFNTTSTGPAADNTSGTALLQYGGASMSRTNSITLDLNRASSDGSIINFRKDGTTVGTIGTFFGDLTIGDDDVGIRFDTGIGLVPWDLGATTTGGSATNGTISLGVSGARFKDLHLSSKTTYQAAGGNQHSIGVDANDLIIRSETAGSETARFTYGGNVGIGTSSPTRPLTVSKAGAQIVGEFINPTASQTARIYVTCGTQTGMLQQKGNTHASDPNTLSLVTTSGDISLTPSGVERLRVTAAGKVGIGTASPSEKLSVDGNITTTGDVNLTAGASDWSFNVVGNDLVISYGGANKAKLDTSGNLTVVGNVTAYGSI